MVRFVNNNQIASIIIKDFDKMTIEQTMESLELFKTILIEEIIKEKLQNNKLN
jgi:hypothetical protein